MNTLIPRFRSCFGHISYWKSPNWLKENIYEPKQRIQTKFQHLQNSSLPRFEVKLLNSEFRLITGLYWTQKRYQKQCPRFHRDVQMPDFDFYRKKQFKDVSKTTWGEGDEKPGLVYVAGFFSMLCGAYGFKSHLTHYVTYMGPAADVLALASIEVDLGKIEPGVCVSIKWRGKPLFVKHRTPADIDFESQTPLASLRDPETPEQRAKKPEWLIVVGICTHLGCVPVPNSGDYPGGFYCPCHGSHYDNIGRARKGPAPLNLEVPPYKFLSDTLVIVG